MTADSKAMVHIVCLPYPTQGQMNPMLKLAKLLNSKGFHITFVNMEYNHRRLLRTRGSNALDGSPSFRFEYIPDGVPLPDDDDGVTQNIPIPVHIKVGSSLEPFVELLRKLNDPSSGSPPVTHILSDCVIPFCVDAARQMGDLPLIFFWAAAAVGFLGFSQYPTLLEKGIVPFKDASFQTDGSLETLVDWVPSFKGMQMKYLPSYMRTTDKNDPAFNTSMRFVQRPLGYPIIINTCEALEHDFLEEMSLLTNAPIYKIGLLHSQLKNALGDNNKVRSIECNLWKEDSQCGQWLDKWERDSVVYVSFGSITTLTRDQLVEFAWGLANSKRPFLWTIRPDIITGDAAMVPPEFLEAVKDRSFVTGWCDQEKVLNHSSVGAFLTHCGWNSTLDGIMSEVPLICWPFNGEQQTNCWYACEKLGIGMEIDNNVKRSEVETLIKEVMEGEKGKQMKRNVKEWKRLAEEATKSPSGSSYIDLDRLVNQEFLPLANQDFHKVD